MICDCSIRMDESLNRRGRRNVRRRLQFSLAALMSFVTACCFLCAMAKSLGVIGIAIFVCFVLTLLWHANIFEVDTLFGIPVPRITFFQLCVLILVVLTLLGLVLPVRVQF
jgi:hypothetical protein